MGLDTSTSGFAEAFAQVGTSLDEASPSLSQRFGVFGRHDRAGFAEDRAGVAHVGDDRGDTAGHGFSQRIREGFAGGTGGGYVERVDDAGDVVAASEEEANFSHSGCLGPIFEFGVLPRGAVAAESEADIRKLFVKQSRSFEESAVVFHRMLAGDVADQQSRVRDTEFVANRSTREVIGTEEIEIESVGDDHHAIVCVAELFVERTRRLRCADNAAWKAARQGRTCLRGPDRMSLVYAGMQLAVPNIPDETSATGELRRETADQVGVVHPRLNDLLIG